MEHDQHSNTPSLHHSNSVVVGIITISDRASGGDACHPEVAAATTEGSHKISKDHAIYRA